MRQTSTATKDGQPTTTAPPKVIPPRPAVSQATLAEILKRRREIKEAEKSLKAQKDALADREWAVIQALEKGATVALAVLTASINHEARRNVKWREVAEQYLGQDFCGLVVEETEPTIYPRLVIA